MESNNKPSWMILKNVPVIPADLRPMVQLDGGRFATSDLNDLYRRVINRNNRLKKLLEIKAPEIVVKNEKRMLQEAVRELKSLSDMLKGKQGRFRQNLLGKRVDYSARSVIVVGPSLKMNQCGIPKKMALELYKPFIMRELVKRELATNIKTAKKLVIVVGPSLKMNQCGIPKKMALELYKPFIMRELVKRELATNIKTAKKLVEEADDKVWDVIEDVIKDHPVLLNRAPTLHRLSIQAFEPVLIEGKAIRLHPLVKVWDVIEDVIKDHPVLLNRAPTLHRLSIQAFEPVLIEGKAIRLHPLVCSAFNADFDGDQMAVHLVLSPEAIMEAKLLMLAPNNIISPANGQPIAIPGQDMVMGCFYMTKDRPGCKGEGKLFSNKEQVLTAYQNGVVDTHSIIKVRIKEEFVTTTPGRILFAELLPEEIRDYHMTYGKGPLKKLIGELYERYGFVKAAEIIDKLKNFGYHYSTFAGVSVGIEDLEIPASKKEILENADKEVARIEQEYKAGHIINEERYRRTIAVWSQATAAVTDAMMNGLENADKEVARIEQEYKAGHIINEERYRRTIAVWSQATAAVTDAMMNGLDEFNPVYMMANSGARGSIQQMRQLAAMRGNMADTRGRIIEVPIKANFREGLTVLEFFMSSQGSIQQMRQLAAMRGNMADTRGRIIEVPIKANFREGLTVLEFFMSSHGARKGLADTALRTADSGYLTRRLVDISHEVMVNADDCGTHEGIEVAELVSDGNVIETLAERINGRVLAEDLIVDGEVIAPRNTMIGKALIKKIEELGIKKVKIRTPLTCALEKGVCKKCYGMDLSNHKEVLLGEAVGVIAAQSIGEPGTQLTMRTFHTGGVAMATASATTKKAEVSGKLKFKDVKILVNEETNDEIVVSQSAKISIGNYDHEIPSGAILRVKEGDTVQAGDILADIDPYHVPIICDQDGTVAFKEIYIKANYDEKYDVTEGDTVQAGDILADIDPYHVPIICDQDGTVAFKEIYIKANYDEKYDVTEYLAVKPVESGDANPRLIVYDKDYNPKASYPIPFGAYLMVKEGDYVTKGHILAKLIKEGEGTKDITGGLPCTNHL